MKWLRKLFIPKSRLGDVQSIERRVHANLVQVLLHLQQMRKECDALNAKSKTKDALIRLIEGAHHPVAECVVDVRDVFGYFLLEEKLHTKTHAILKRAVKKLEAGVVSPKNPDLKGYVIRAIADIKKQLEKEE
jgi:hypothetical protein